MDNYAVKKQEYLVQIAQFILSHGISSCSLKKMAEYASTSDRMLMHYFKDKDEILTLALKRISQDMFQQLNAVPKLEFCFEEFVPFLIKAIRSDQFKPYLDLWFELIHLASCEKEPYSSISKEIGDSYWNWILSMHKPSANDDKASLTALLFMFTEGLVMLDKMGMREKSDIAVKAMLKMYMK